VTRAFVNRFCAGLPGAEHSDPWGGGHDAWKVGGKLFAVVAAREEALSIKCRDVEAAMDEDELGERILASYHLTTAALPKKLRKALEGT
jgi:predicted DNA-binding protein (MmcQ/YjbR family)